MSEGPHPLSSPGAPEYIAKALALGRGVVPTARLTWGSHPRQAVEIFCPPPQEHPRPVLTFFNGGCWIAGGLEWLRFMAPAVNRTGAILATGTYRLAPEFRWPLPYRDVCRTIDFVTERIADFGGDPTRHAVGGHSAGGHLASLAVLREDILPVRACFPVSSAFDIQYGEASPADSAEGRVYRFLLAHPRQDFKASPVNFVAGARTPFHVIWGERDFERIRRSGKQMVEAMEREKAPFTWQVIDQVDHFGTHLMLSESTSPWYQKVAQALLPTP